MPNQNKTDEPIAIDEADYTTKRHTHKALYAEEDGELQRDCALCGKDLTNPLHFRVGEFS